MAGVQSVAREWENNRKKCSYEITRTIDRSNGKNGSAEQRTIGEEGGDENRVYVERRAMAYWPSNDQYICCWAYRSYGV
jgi:hypothetical protein